MCDVTITLASLIEKALLVVTKTGLCTSTIEANYKIPFGRIQRFCNGFDEPFSVDMLDRYIVYIEQPLEDGTWAKAYYYLNRHAALLLLDCARTEEPVWRQYRKQRFKYTPCTKHIELTEMLISSMGSISDSHAARTRRYLRQFFCYIEQLGLGGCDNIDTECIRSFISDIANEQPKEAEFIIFSLRIHYGCVQ
jgi:hypothetical protein